MPTVLTCTPKRLPRDLWISAAKTAVEINPVNHPPLQHLLSVMPSFSLKPERIAVVTTKFWHAKGVKLTVGFLDNPPQDLRARILQNMNAWSSRINASFVETNSDAQVRIARTQGDGYWSFLGTDILSITAGQPTMNLDSFTMQMPESEFHRVIRHETGHTLGCPHEHMRRELVDRIDEEKAIEFFGETQGWTPEEVRQQVLTPIEEGSLLGTAQADPNSIMCYQIPGTITKDGQPILGGIDIDESDFQFMAGIYPKPDAVAAAVAPGVSAGELEQLREERDALKKALVILARDR
jgi:Astacin (Peptidase family M12A)